MFNKWKYKACKNKKRITAFLLAASIGVSAVAVQTKFPLFVYAATFGTWSCSEDLAQRFDKAAAYQLTSPAPGVRTDMCYIDYTWPSSTNTVGLFAWQLSKSSKYSKFSWADTYCMDHGTSMDEFLHQASQVQENYPAIYFFGYYTLDGGGDGTKYPGRMYASCGQDKEKTKFNFLMLAYAAQKQNNIGHQRTSMSDNTMEQYLSQRIAAAAEEGWFSGVWANDASVKQRINATIGSQLVGESLAQALALCDSYFDEVWYSAMAAYICATAADSGGLEGGSAPQIQADGKTHITLPYDPQFFAKMQQAKIKTYGDWTYVVTANQIDFSSPTGDTSAGIADIDFSGVPGIMQKWIGKESCASIRIPSRLNDETISFNMQQERLACAMDNDPIIHIKPGNSSGGGSGSINTGNGYTVIRYDHKETWESNYKVTLLKRDSETGEPLEGVTYDILEAFDDSQLNSTSLEDDNWANDNGTQFDKWEDWDGPYPDGGSGDPDPCPKDEEYTGEDGYLYESDSAGGPLFPSSTKAHNDQKYYIYNKGYCGGHPEPPETDDEDEAEELQEQYEAELEKCEKLVAEGGYFCGGAADEDGSIAKTMMEEDRDKHYQEFVSLTYDYSARELEARDGYILHNADENKVHGVYENYFDGIHTDTIPIETVNVHSSEYYDVEANGIKHGAASGASEDGQSLSGYSLDGEAALRTLSGAEANSITIATDSSGLSEDTGAYEEAEGFNAEEEVEDEAVSSQEAKSTTQTADQINETLASAAENLEIFADNEFLSEASGQPAADTGSTEASTEKTDEIKEGDTLENSSEETGTSIISEEDADITEKILHAAAEDESDSTADDEITVLKDADSDDSTDTIFADNEFDSGSAEKAHSMLSGIRTRIATLSEADDETGESGTITEDELKGEDGELLDIEITEDGTYTLDGRRVASATNSEAEAASGGGETFLGRLFEWFRDASGISLLAGDDDDDDMGSGRDAGGKSHPERDSTYWTNSPAEQVSPADKEYKYGGNATLDGADVEGCDWLFLVYDHRTEGEIHFNKRDLDLDNDRSDQFDDYAWENADGTLEGAVYGLFAADDITHPDGKTGVVYEKDDLVAVAVTDRNGDGSFLVCTEEPGSSYDYAAGSIKQSGGGVANLYTDAYPMHSSNENSYYGEQWYYPISNNESDNGNCWIGRPLILGAYYICELSRSEGYELSVYGKDDMITNRVEFANNGAFSLEGKVAVVNTQSPDRDDNGDWKGTTEAEIHSEGTTNGYDVVINGIEPDRKPHIFLTTKVLETFTYESTGKKPVKVQIPAQAGNLVVIDGSLVEASVGDVVTTPSGNTYTVNATELRAVNGAYITYTAGLDGRVTIPEFTSKYYAYRSRYNYSSTNDFVEKWNGTLSGEAGFAEPGTGAPYALVSLGDSSNYRSWENALNAYFDEDNLDVPAYNAARIERIINKDGSYYAVVRYAFVDASGTPYNLVASATDGAFYLKYSITYSDGTDGWIYRKITLDEIQADAKASVITGASGRFTGITVENLAPQGSVTLYEDMNGIQWASGVTYKEYWAYADGEYLLDNEGNYVYDTVYEDVPETVTGERYVYTDTELDYNEANYDAKAGTYTLHIAADQIPADGTLYLTVRYERERAEGMPLKVLHFSASPSMGGSSTYIVKETLEYPGQYEVRQDAGTIEAPTPLVERPIRQKVKVNKDIQTLPEAKNVWYCINCGFENEDSAGDCAYCGHKRTTEETKTIHYAHDTYSAVHAENISAERDAGWYETATDWLTKLMGGTAGNGESEKDIPNFRFKAYLKSNLERLYRDEAGKIVWLDRNGNTMVPQYEDTNGDGNYDTFTWKYEGAYDGKGVDFPEKDRMTDDGVLESSNVQKIYTQVPHEAGSKTTSAQANNVWSQYKDPQDGYTDEAGEKEGFNTSERETLAGATGDLSGKAVDTNAALYSYDGKNRDVAVSDRINENQNTGYTRLLEMTERLVEDGAGKTRTVQAYNYEKFFDAIHAANQDIWDDDMNSTYTGTGMNNYPGQHWFETFYEEYQKDDTDPAHTLENTDKADKDGTAGGDRDTSFKPFRWIREHVFGYRDGYEKYPADNNGVNTENTANTSYFARANAEASDAVRQFAVKWYLKQEAGKLLVNNGVDENIALADNGNIPYDEAVYDEALFNAIAKSYNYLRPFYENDLDTIYSVEWDSAEGGGSDKDYTTLSVDQDDGEEHYGISAYLPYGVYVIVEQTPERRDKSVNDWENRNYTIEKPKEVLVPSVYDAAQANDTTDNYDTHYNYSYNMTTQEQAKESNYLIRFGEEWAHNNRQDEREYVIRAHNYHGDFEVYKYGLDIDLLNSAERAYKGINDGGAGYQYNGWNYSQSIYDPLKDYYDTQHRGEEGVAVIGTENGGNDADTYLTIDRTEGDQSSPGMRYNTKALVDRFFYGSISEDAGKADNVMYKGGGTDDNNVSGMQWKDRVRSMTGELTAYEGRYAQMLVPWTVTAAADIHEYASAEFSGYADVNERDSFYTTFLRINKTDSETGEYLLHDNAIFALYAGSRYQSFEEIEDDAKLIADTAEREKFLAQFKPGDAKFYLQDTVIEGTREFLMAMGATEITPFARGRFICS